MSKYFNTRERLRYIEELGELWLNLYENREKLSELQWKEYKRTICEYLQDELELIWLYFYNNRDDLSEEDWKEYERVMYLYLRLVVSKN